MSYSTKDNQRPSRRRHPMALRATAVLAIAGAATGIDVGIAQLAGASTSVTSPGAQTKGNIAFASAQKVLGATYAWGGGTDKGPSKGIHDGGVADSYGDYNKIGFDCSGFTTYASAQAGFDWAKYDHSGEFANWRHVSAGAQHTVVVDSGIWLGKNVSQYHVGDLLFFQTGSHIHHVGMYAGIRNGVPTMINAPDSGSVVRYDTFADRGDFIGGGRLPGMGEPIHTSQTKPKPAPHKAPKSKRMEHKTPAKPKKAPAVVKTAPKLPSVASTTSGNTDMVDMTGFSNADAPNANQVSTDTEVSDTQAATGFGSAINATEADNHITPSDTVKTDMKSAVGFDPNPAVSTSSQATTADANTLAAATGFGPSVPVAITQAPKPPTTSLTRPKSKVEPKKAPTHLPVITVHHTTKTAPKPVHKHTAPKSADGLYGANNRIKVVDYFVRYHGYTPEGAAAVAGNFMQEASPNIDPNANQSGGPGVGIGQWSNPGRWNNLTSWASARGLNPYALRTQLDFAQHELESTFPSTLAQVKNATSVDSATKAFEYGFESAGKPEMDQRIAYAHQSLSEYLAQA